MRKITYELLRWEMTTSQLKQYADLLKIDLGDIPNNTNQKERIANRIWERIKEVVGVKK